jgi:hypothetical protein
MSNFTRGEWPTARKRHCCIWCGEPIPVGEKHYHYTGRWGDEWQDWRMHRECKGAFSKGAVERFSQVRTRGPIGSGSWSSMPPNLAPPPYAAWIRAYVRRAAEGFGRTPRTRVTDYE